MRLASLFGVGNAKDMDMFGSAVPKEQVSCSPTAAPVVTRPSRSFFHRSLAAIPDRENAMSPAQLRSFSNIVVLSTAKAIVTETLVPRILHRCRSDTRIEEGRAGAKRTDRRPRKGIVVPRPLAVSRS